MNRLLLVSFALVYAPLAQAAFKDLCAERSEKVVRIQIDKEGTAVIQGNESKDPEQNPSVSWSGDLNRDGTKDYILYEGNCGNRGDCLHGVYAGCGGDKFRIVYGPEYFPDTPKVSKPKPIPSGEAWADLTYLDHADVTDPESPLLGWRLQYHAGEYRNSFSESEYRDLFKKAKAGKDFARHQLFVSFYQIASGNENDPTIRGVKALGLGLAFVRQMIAHDDLPLSSLPVSLRDNREIVLLYVRSKKGINCPNDFALLSERLRDDLELMKEVAQRNPYPLSAASERVRKLINAERKKANASPLPQGGCG